jgi:hypothetical protein
MPMPLYEVLCGPNTCGRPAVFKIAAAWSDGVTSELKTYSVCCAECLPRQLAAARRRRAECRLTLGETLDELGVYELVRGRRDTTLIRRTDLENG